MLTSSNIVKQKAIFEKICEFKTSGIISSPREDSNGTMYVVTSLGEIFSFYEGGSEQMYLINNGRPTGICFDNLGYVYISDLSANAIFFKNNNFDNTHLIDNILVKEYDERPLKGPTSLTFNKDEGEIYVTDAGDMLNSSIYPNNGSLFVIDLDSKIIRPILLNCLSFPADVLYDNIRKCLYVAETFTNRIIRLTQNPEGVFHSSVFCQFNGRLGPTALAMDEFGYLYVARFEFQNPISDNDGLISVLNREGVIVGELFLSKLPEITGLLISPKKKESLFLTEKNSNGVLKIKLTHFISEIDKSKFDNENLKFN